ncbi:LLM class flavin-dependent oxidoreductase [Kocuria sp. cx-455]|uniref:LLM class flavin-dependent oxidoreductase n=1 Tax=Kocuria sp. cx-455 TaxID=2771377 RepID=UPI003D707DBE
MGIPLSLLDRSRTRQGHTDSAALHQTVERARRAEEVGFHRFWVSEHHGVPGVASGTPALLAQAVAAATNTIRVGSGGVMLPNHRPIVVAEEFAVLTALQASVSTWVWGAPWASPNRCAKRSARCRPGRENSRRPSMTSASI